MSYNRLEKIALLAILLGSQCRGQVTDSNYLFLVGGYTEEGNSDLVEVISLDPVVDPVPSCMQNLSAFPYRIRSAPMALLGPNSAPVVCGGYGSPVDGDEPDNELDLCHEYDYATDTWAEIGRLPTAIDYSGWDSHPDWGLVIAGGEDADLNDLDSFYETTDGINIGYPGLPLIRHTTRLCVAAIDADRIFVGGGTTVPSEAFIFDNVDIVWRTFDDMPQPVYDHSCGVVYGGENGPEVIVAGGFNGNELDDVQIFNPDAYQWRLAANPLPMKLRLATTARHGDSFVIVGGRLEVTGYSPYVYRYDPGTEDWTRMSGELSVPRDMLSAVFVRKESFPGC